MSKTRTSVVMFTDEVIDADLLILFEIEFLINFHS